MAPFLYLFCFNFITIVSSYWLSQNRLSWFDSSNYCQSRCNSELASIHSINEHLQARNLIANSSTITYGFGVDEINVWIGLNKLNGDWSWNDNSSFNYGTDTITKGVVPWAPSEPNELTTNDKCTEYYVNFDLLWNDEDCQRYRRFLCNTCEGLLDKYVLFRAVDSFANALDFCENTLGTSLASIHSVEDMNEAAFLCKVVNTNCWLGLYRMNTLSPFEWSDDTFFDYGRYHVTNGEYPWGQWIGGGYPAEPNNYAGNEYCVEISAGHNFTWNDNICDNTQFFLCNKPNELCDHNQWSILYSSHSDLLINKCVAQSTDFGAAVIRSKQWNNNNNMPLKIQYMFAVHKRNIRNSHSQIGITAHMFHTEIKICDFYFVGLLIDDNNNTYIVCDIVKNDMIERRNISDQSFIMQYNRYYELQVEIISVLENITFKYNLVITNTTILSGIFTDTNSDLFSDIILPKYFGISNDNANITAKSLFISGTPQYNVSLNPLNLMSCSLKPTVNPTIETTDPTTTYPSNQPSISPTRYPSYIPTISPSQNPTNIPTQYPSYNPSLTPTINPTNEDVINEISTHVTVNQTANDGSSMGNNVNEMDNMFYVYISVVAGILIIVICIAMCLFLFMKKKNKNEKTEKTKETIGDIEILKLNSTSKHRIIPTISKYNNTIGNAVDEDQNSDSGEELYKQEITDNENNIVTPNKITKGLTNDGDEDNSDDELYNTEITDNVVTPKNTTKGEM